MRLELVAVGVFMIVFGVVVIVIGYFMQSGITPVMVANYQGYANSYNTGLGLMATGGILAALGLALVVYGRMVGPRPQVEYVTPQELRDRAAAGRFCQQCGARVNQDASFCGKCGKALG
jgi:ribosomal protein L40E